MELTSGTLTALGSCTTPEKVGRFRTKKNQKMAPAMAPAMATPTREQLTAIPMVAFLSSPDQFPLLGAAVAVPALVVVTGAAVGVGIIFDLIVVLTELVELVERGASRMLAIRTPRPRLQQVVLSGLQQ